MTGQKIEYVILESTTSADDLRAVVNAAPTEGWQLQGGVSVALSESDYYRYALYAQAMTRVVQPEG